MQSLSERIAARAKTKASPQSNRAIFLALRDDVRQSLNDGWSVLAVYQTLHDEGAVTFSYQAFRRYVNELLLGKPEAQKVAQRANRPITKTAAQSKIASFIFNSAPNKEDLI